ncbi:MAG: hypothetical protein IKH57_24620 [Clostridia bacterium]|nr:hypothetical protein [Clostridia bacterium]
MTNEQFWAQITTMIKTDAANHMLPFFISQGVASALSIPVVVNNHDEMIYLPCRGMVFVYCCTGKKPKDAPKSAKVRIMPLQQLLFYLEEGELDGIAFLEDDPFIGIELKELEV